MLISVTLCAFAFALGGTSAPLSDSTRVTYVGDAKVSSAADGGLRPVVGVKNIQVVRANRTHPEHQDALNDTYLHAPMLAYWHGYFHLDYLSAPINEHETPTQTSYTRSVDGVHWQSPRLLFPAYVLPDGNLTLNHQRMSFYVAPNDRFLATAFYGMAPKPNDGSGIARAVREIFDDGSFGPVYFIRYNQQPGWRAENAAAFPLYTEAADPGFVQACDALLSDRKMTAQWWEEDRSEDGFYRVKGKAMSYFTLANGRIIGLWKDAQVGYSDDGGDTWIRNGFAANLKVNSSKYWGQETGDGNFVLVYNPTQRLRHPLALMTSADGVMFDHLSTVHSELPVQRFPGLYKNMGPQYVRGIVEGNGESPDSSLWLTYSVNKEDIWVCSVPVPIQQSVADREILEDFSSIDADGDTMPAPWNCYRPLWASVGIKDIGNPHGQVLELTDEDPYDYASVTRVFKTSRSVCISFDILPAQNNGRLEVDVCSSDGQRPVQIAFTENGNIEAKHEGIWKQAGSYDMHQWQTLTLDINPGADDTDRYEVLVNGAKVLYRTAYFSDYPTSVERITFRTGEYRQRGDGGHRLPDADVKAAVKSYLIDNVHIISRD